MGVGMQDHIFVKEGYLKVAQPKDIRPQAWPPPSSSSSSSSNGGESSGSESSSSESSAASSSASESEFSPRPCPPSPRGQRRPYENTIPPTKQWSSPPSTAPIVPLAPEYTCAPRPVLPFPLGAHRPPATDWHPPPAKAARTTYGRYSDYIPRPRSRSPRGERRPYTNTMLQSNTGTF